MSTIHLIEGPVGAGKSTFSGALSQELKAPHFNLDSWMARLFSPDRPETGTMQWYVERKARCIEQIWHSALGTLDAGCDVILELGLVQREPRQAMYHRIEASGHELAVYVLDAPRDERRTRVRLRNVEQGDTFSMVVPDAVFELASDFWEAPSQSESDTYGIVFVPQDSVDKAMHCVTQQR